MILYKSIISSYVKGTVLLATLFLFCNVAVAQETSPEEFIKKLETAKNIEDTIEQYYNIGYWYSFYGNDTEGDKYTYTAIKLSKENKLLTNEAQGYYLAAEKFSFASNNDSAGYYAQKSIEIYNKAGKKQIYYVHALNILASIALENAAADEATKLAHQQMKVAIELNDTASISSSYNLLSAIYESLNEMDKAIAYSQKALELNRLSGKMFNRSQALCNLSMLYIEEGMSERAYSLLYEAMNAATIGFPSERDKTIVQTYLGLCHHSNGHIDSAYLYFNKAKNSIANIGEPDISMRLWEAYAEVCRLTGGYDTALAYINKSVALSEQYDILDHYAYGLKIKSGILADMGRYRNAYEVYLAHISLKDSLSGLAMQETIAELEEKYESDKKDERIAEEQRRNKLLIAGISIALALVALILFQYIRQKQATQTIRKQSDKLTLLMKELHHRVKNNLQIISSLLSLQSFRIKDQAASKAVRDGQQRIEAMSLIHQRLYTRDNITEINIREFINDLVDSLQNAYGYNKESINIRMQIDDELMNVDQAIPLSLIINELVTNAFKYAYEDNDNPELVVTLKKEDNNLKLVVADNGKGVNISEWNDKEGSFGKELIQTFVQQLNGYLDVMVNKGSKFTLTIPYTA